MEYLVINNEPSVGPWLNFIAQVFISSRSFTRQDKIIALELIGAFLNMHSPFNSTQGVSTHLPIELGLHCWREAMTLRYFPSDGEPLLPKIPDVSVPSVASSVVFGSAVEVISMEELDLLEEDLKRDLYRGERLTSKKLIQRQALLVIRRITSQSNNEHPHWLYLVSLDKLRSDLFKDGPWTSGDYKLTINTFVLILEQITEFDPIVLSRKSFVVFIHTLHEMSRYLIQMLQKPPNIPGSRELTYANFLPPSKFFGTIAKFFPNPATMSSRIVNYQFEGCCNDFAQLMFKFVFILESISPRLSSQEKQKLEEYYSTCIRDFFPERTTTVLHATVWSVETGRGLLRCVANLKSIELILKLGADPNAIDEKGRTPLQILSEKDCGFFLRICYLRGCVKIFRALVDAGTHLDIAADNGETVLSLLKKTFGKYRGHRFRHPYYESLISTVSSLSCHCAVVIRRSGIRYERLPLCLQTFVSRHSAKGN
jgi:hypothetical protein